MSNRRPCSECGALLLEDLPQGPCPVCALQGALALSGGDSAGVVTEQPGEQIGPYTLLKKLGEGGYGIVYLADQTEPLRRRVALKVIKPGMDSRQVIARFEAERQALATMDHPGIAKVFEAGATATGRPYFVMELVGGARITDYCNEHELSTRARLDLFVEVCRAVQHAHQKGIIHRDLKPSHILVALHMPAAFVLLLVAGALASTWQAVRATRAERQQALLRRQAQAAETASRTEAARSWQVAKFLTDMLDGVGPSVALGRDTKMLHEILDKTAVRVGKDLKNQPDVEAELRNTIGNVYAELGDYTKADAMLRQALALRKSVFGDKHLRVADSLHDLGALRRDQGKPAEAEALFRQALAMRRELLGNEHPEVANSLNSIGAALFDQGNFAKAEEFHRQALALRKTLFGNEHPLLATTLANLGTALWYENKFPEAEAAYRETLAMQRKLMGDEHPDVATSLHNLACVLQSQGSFSEAEPLCKQALEMRRKLLGAEHPLFASTLSALAAIYQGQGRFAEAETTERDALAIQRKRLGPEHPEAAVSLNNLGDILRVEGKLAEAETVQREAVGLLKKALGGDHQLVAISIDVLGNILRDEGKLADAEACHREALGMRGKVLAGDHPDMAQSLNDLAPVYELFEGCLGVGC